MSMESAAACDLQPVGALETCLLPTPAELIEELPVESMLAARISNQRNAVRDILTGEDDRLLVICGPCSLHDRDVALDYGRRLAALAEALSDRAVFVMRAYVEKPRTTVGWKGLLHDPDLDGTNDTLTGLRAARDLLLELARLGLPIGTELLTPLAVDYLADTLSWAAVGARTTESQTHRERMSALALPVGFKNGTAGEIATAIDAIRAACHPQHYIGTDAQGRPAAISTPGNPDAHLILRGGRHGTNYDAASVAEASEALRAAGRPARVIIDCNHANSGKIAARQVDIMAELAARRRAGETAVAGVMIESNIMPGQQKVGPDMAYGVSITDDCLGWDGTEAILRDALSG